MFALPEHNHLWRFVAQVLIHKVIVVVVVGPSVWPRGYWRSPGQRATGRGVGAQAKISQSSLQEALHGFREAGKAHLAPLRAVAMFCRNLGLLSLYDRPTTARTFPRRCRFSIGMASEC